jgi:hypothetical protein
MTSHIAEIGVPQTFLYFKISGAAVLCAAFQILPNDAIALSDLIAFEPNIISEYCTGGSVLYNFYDAHRRDFVYMFIDGENAIDYEARGESDLEWIYQIINGNSTIMIPSAEITRESDPEIWKIARMQLKRGIAHARYMPFYDESDVLFHNRIQNSALSKCGWPFAGLICTPMSNDRILYYGAIYICAADNGADAGTAAKILEMLHSRGIIIGRDSAWVGGIPFIGCACHTMYSDKSDVCELFAALCDDKLGDALDIMENGFRKDMLGAYRKSTIADIRAAFKSIGTSDDEVAAICSECWNNSADIPAAMLVKKYSGE